MREPSGRFRLSPCALDRLFDVARVTVLAIVVGCSGLARAAQVVMNNGGLCGGVHVLVGGYVQITLDTPLYFIRITDL